jgi:excisionase family DNA binding protein
VTAVTTRTNTVGALDGGAPRLLRIEDVADRLTVSRSMAWKLVAGGELRSVRIGRSVRVRPVDLEAYLADPARER